MINANLIRKSPETLEHYSTDEYQLLLKELENNILKYNSSGATSYHLNICIKDLEKDQTFYIVKSDQHRKSLTRLVASELLNNDFDVQYAEYTFNNVTYTKLSIKW